MPIPSAALPFCSWAYWPSHFELTLAVEGSEVTLLQGKTFEVHSSGPGHKGWLAPAKCWKRLACTRLTLVPEDIAADCNCCHHSDTRIYMHRYTSNTITQLQRCSCVGRAGGSTSSWRECYRSVFKCLLLAAGWQQKPPFLWKRWCNC